MIGFRKGCQTSHLEKPANSGVAW